MPDPISKAFVLGAETIEKLRQENLALKNELQAAQSSERIANGNFAKVLVQRDRLLSALEDAQHYIEAVVFNSQPGKKQSNYIGCLRRIESAIASVTQPTTASEGAHHD